VQKRILP